ncbi:MAG: AI-2E family transporter [Nitriliruptoraceae bacterium]
MPTRSRAQPASEQRERSADDGTSMTDTAGASRIRKVGATAWSLLGIIAILALAGWLAGRLSLLVVPLILALFPATLLVPVAAKLRSLGAPSSLAAITSILLAFLVLGGLIGSMIPLVANEVPELVDSAADGVEEIETFLENDPLGLGIEGPAELLSVARDQLGEIGDYTGQAMSAASTTAEVLAGLLLLFVVLFFYLKDGRRLTDGVLSVAPRSIRPRLGRAAERSWEALGSYFRGQLTVALIDAVFIGIGLLILGIPLAVPLAVLIFFGALFPLIGALVTGGLAVLVALADGGLVAALIVLALIVGVQQVEGNFLQPIIIGRAIDLHPLVVVLAITAGGVLFGILGAFLAVPVAAIVARVVAEDPQPPPPTQDGSEPDAGSAGVDDERAEQRDTPEADGADPASG